jgi:hypothetical protein
MDTAWRYMRLAYKIDENGSTLAAGGRTTLHEAIGEKHTESRVISKKNKLKSLFDGVDKVNVSRLSDERRSNDDLFSCATRRQSASSCRSPER